MRQALRWLRMGHNPKGALQRYREAKHTGLHKSYLLAESARQDETDPPAPLSFLDLKNRRNLKLWQAKRVKL